MAGEYADLPKSDDEEGLLGRCMAAVEVERGGSALLWPARHGLPSRQIKGLVGSMPLQLLEVGFHVEIHAIEWHDFQRETQFHGVVVA